MTMVGATTATANDQCTDPDGDLCPSRSAKRPTYDPTHPAERLCSQRPSLWPQVADGNSKAGATIAPCVHHDTCGDWRFVTSPP